MLQRSRFTRTCAALAVTAATLAGSAAAAGQAGAEPAPRNYVKTIRCDSPSPLLGPPLRITVDVWNKVRFPSDGLPGPVIELIANGSRTPGIVPSPNIYTVETTVRWKNVSTGRSGVVRVPTRTSRVTWQAVLHPGPGRVNFTVHQKIGAMALVPMVNPQYSSCRGSATA